MPFSALDLAGVGMTSPRARKRLIDQLRDQGIDNERVLAAMLNQVPRHLFVDEGLRKHVYQNSALSIGHGQTISQPYIVALMTQLALAQSPCKRVLEIGTGSGYQAALLSRLVDRVYTVERIDKLHQRAKNLFAEFGFGNIAAYHTDGVDGLAAYAPYDVIMVTAASHSDVPQKLLQQLVIGGRLIIPLGEEKLQSLLQIYRARETVFERTKIAPVAFVPLKSGLAHT